MKHIVRTLTCLLCLTFFGSEVVWAVKYREYTLAKREAYTKKRAERFASKKRENEELFQGAERLFSEMQKYCYEDESVFPPYITDFYFKNIAIVLRTFQILRPAQQQRELNWMLGGLGFFVRKMQKPTCTLADDANKRFNELGANITDKASERELNGECLRPEETWPKAASFEDLEVIWKEFADFKEKRRARSLAIEKKKIFDLKVAKRIEKELEGLDINSAFVKSCLSRKR